MKVLDLLKKCMGLHEICHTWHFSGLWSMTKVMLRTSNWWSCAKEPPKSILRPAEAYHTLVWLADAAKHQLIEEITTVQRVTHFNQLESEHEYESQLEETVWSLEAG